MQKLRQKRPIMLTSQRLKGRFLEKRESRHKRNTLGETPAAHTTGSQLTPLPGKSSSSAVRPAVQQEDTDVIIQSAVPEVKWMLNIKKRCHFYLSGRPR